MKIARFFAGILAFCGGVLMIASVALCLMNLDAPVRLGEIPAEAQQRAQAFGDAIAAGDFAAASEYVYGKPELGSAGEPAGREAQAVLAVYRSSLSFSFQGDFYATTRGLARKASVTVMDIPSMTGKVAGYASTLMNERVAAATTMEELYDENNNFRRELIDSVMEQALNQALSEGGAIQSYETTLEIIYRDDAWWVLPDQTLLNALKGGIA